MFDFDQIQPGDADERSNLFAIRGYIDGEAEQDFTEKEQFIGVTIGKEEFLLPITSVIDINMLSEITFIPHAPRFVDGVINLRGIIVPAINLRKMMGITKALPTPAARIIFVNECEIEVGLLVDSITYVVSLVPSEIENRILPSKSGAELITRIGKHEHRVLGILDLAKILQIVSNGRFGKSESEEIESKSEKKPA